MSTETTWEHLKNLEDWISILSFEPVSLQELARKFGENPPYSPDGANYVCEAATQMRSESIHVPAEWCKRQGPGAHHLDAYWFTAVFQNRLKKKSMPQFYWDIWKGQSQRLPLLAEIWTSKAVDQRFYTCTFLSFNKTFVFRLVGMYRAKVQTETSDWNFSVLQISKCLMWLES